jgi:hypothetical protein
MFKPSDNLVLPPPETKIWRYMDLTKLLSILVKRSLFFNNITTFDDKYEGFVPVMTPDDLKRAWQERNPKSPISEIEYEKAHSDHEFIRDFRKTFRDLLFANCWHINEEQSAAMWKLYLSTSEGVAVQSTVQRLSDSLNKTTKDIYIGKVNYVKFDSLERGSISGMQSAFLKRLSFEHERELRAVYIDLNDERMSTLGTFSKFVAGYDIEIEPDILIEKVLIAPTSPPWIEPVIQAALDKFSLNRTVVRSNLNDGPVW